MRIERIGIKLWDLQFDARDELYSFIDRHYNQDTLSENIIQVSFLIQQGIDSASITLDNWVRLVRLIS